MLLPCGTGRHAATPHRRFAIIRLSFVSAAWRNCDIVLIGLSAWSYGLGWFPVAPHEFSVSFAPVNRVLKELYG